MIEWSRVEWKARQAAHLDRVGDLAEAFAQRRSHGTKHPVEDFLFTYYNLSPAKLKQWVPPLGSAIEATAEDLLECPWLASDRFLRQNNRVFLDEAFLTDHTRQLATWIRDLCDRVSERPTRFRCFGLHEWAMVYRLPAEQIRHQGYELRLTPEELASFVDSQAVCCTHYDAFRFFTPDAVPLNKNKLTREATTDFDQRACIHVTMDLYRFAHKIAPWCSSELIADTFLLAADARRIDMRASPYDLKDQGFEPILIETSEGREEYIREQRRLAELAVPLRSRLIEVYDRLIAASKDTLSEHHAL
jgi:hypothetical protein